MTYLGLLDAKGKEWKSKKYRRLNLTGTHWRLTPPRKPKRFHADFHMLNSIVFKGIGTGHGTVNYLAVYKKAEGGKPVETAKLKEPRVLLKNDSIVVATMTVMHLFIPKR